MCSLHVTQAYIQSTNNQARCVYVRPPHELDDPKVCFLRLRKALYALSYSGEYWHDTLWKVLFSDIELQSSTGDPDVCYSTDGSYVFALDGEIVTQVDDVLGTGSGQFYEHTLPLEQAFDSKPCESPLLKFSVVRVAPLSSPSYRLHQPTYALHLAKLSEDATFGSFRYIRHQLAWLEQTRPDLVTTASIASEVTASTFSRPHIKLLNDGVRRDQTSPDRGLTVHSLH